jgi:hypothetical protein
LTYSASLSLRSSLWKNRCSASMVDMFNSSAACATKLFLLSVPRAAYSSSECKALAFSGGVCGSRIYANTGSV